MRIDMNHPASSWVDVWRDGVLITEVIAVDTDAGWADVSARNAQGEMVVDDMAERAVTGRVRGTFSVTCFDAHVAEMHGIPFRAREGAA